MQEKNNSVPLTQTLPSSLFVWLQKFARKKGYKNSQELINEILRDFKERNETIEEKKQY